MVAQCTTTHLFVGAFQTEKRLEQVGKNHFYEMSGGRDVKS